MTGLLRGQLSSLLAVCLHTSCLRLLCRAQQKPLLKVHGPKTLHKCKRRLEKRMEK